MILKTYKIMHYKNAKKCAKMYKLYAIQMYNYVLYKFIKMRYTSGQS